MKRMKLTRMALLTLITLAVIVSALIAAQTEISLADFHLKKQQSEASIQMSRFFSGGA